MRRSPRPRSQRTRRIDTIPTVATIVRIHGTITFDRGPPGRPTASHPVAIIRARHHRVNADAGGEGRAASRSRPLLTRAPTARHQVRKVRRGAPTLPVHALSGLIRAPSHPLRDLIVPIRG